MIKFRRRFHGFCRAARRHASQLPPAESSRHVARHESAFSPDYGPAFERSNGIHRTRHAAGSRPPSPFTDMQALMEAMPHEEPEESKTAALELRERLGEAVDGLEERQRWIFEAHHYRGLSFRQIARELSISKTTADRVFRDALTHLRERLSG